MNYSKPHPLLFDLQALVVDMALIHRMHFLTGQERNENDIEHSFAVAMLCWYICDLHRLPLDLAKVLKYALIHDFPERYAGDTNSFGSADERANKVIREKAALKRLNREFKHFGDLRSSLEAYEAKHDEEALFVWTVDKMQAMILADIDGWRPYRNYGVSYERFLAKHSEQLATCSRYCKEIFAELLEYCKATYYDQPAGLTPR